MNSNLKRNIRSAMKVLVVVSILIPLGSITYELIIIGNESVMFFANYPTAVAIVILIYYALLLVVGLLWVVNQFKELLILKNEKTKNELLHLQSQVNPHFFFNMLNNLYGLVDKDVEKSKTLILKLSDLMRYSIYEGEKKLVPIEKEVSYLKNYMTLHEMRYHKKIDLQFNTNIDDNQTAIMPLLFIILLENAFKHGVENLREKAFVHIDLTVKKNNIYFEITNNFDQNALPEQAGIGIKNIKRRLELAYPKKHSIIFTNTDGVYKVQLQLQ